MCARLIETLQPPAPPTDGPADRAAAILRQHGCKWVLEAIADNPDGPVTMSTDISKQAVEYEVCIGGPSDRDKGRIIWHKTVWFGATDAHCAGGAAFVAAAREQEHVAWAALELLESAR